MSDGIDPALLAERFGPPDTDRSRLLAQVRDEQGRRPPARRRARRTSGDDVHGRRLDALDQALHPHPDDDQEQS